MSDNFKHSEIMTEIMVLSNYERKKFQLDFVGTEHVLLAIAAREEDPGGQTLLKWGTNYQEIREKVIELHKKDLEEQAGKPPQLYREFTDDARQLMGDKEFIFAEDTGKMLERLMAIPESRAKDVLTMLGVNVDRIIVEEEKKIFNNED